MWHLLSEHNVKKKKIDRLRSWNGSHKNQQDNNLLYSHAYTHSTHVPVFICPNSCETGLFVTGSDLSLRGFSLVVLETELLCKFFSSDARSVHHMWEALFVFYLCWLQASFPAAGMCDVCTSVRATQELFNVNVANNDLPAKCCEFHSFDHKGFSNNRELAGEGLQRLGCASHCFCGYRVYRSCSICCWFGYLGVFFFWIFVHET